MQTDAATVADATTNLPVSEHGEPIMENAVHQVTRMPSEMTYSITDSFQSMFADVINWAPRVVAAVIVLVLGYLVSRLVAKGVAALCERLGLQRAAERSGVVTSLQQVGVKRTFPQIVALIVFWLLMCVFLVAAGDILALSALTGAIQSVVDYIPKLLVATVVVVFGLLLASLLRGVIATGADRVGITYAQQLSNACYWILAMLTFIAAFEQLEIQFTLLREAILIAFGAVALGLGLSFGLGGREVMGGILSGYYVRQRLHTGDRVSIAGFEGAVREIGPVSTTIETEEDGIMRRRSIPNTRMLNEAIR